MRNDDGYEQMMRIEDPYAAPVDEDLDAARVAESAYGALGTGSVSDAERRPPHEETRRGRHRA